MSDKTRWVIEDAKPKLLSVTANGEEALLVFSECHVAEDYINVHAIKAGIDRKDYQVTPHGLQDKKYNELLERATHFAIHYYIVDHTPFSMSYDLAHSIKKHLDAVEKGSDDPERDSLVD